MLPRWILLAAAAAVAQPSDDASARIKTILSRVAAAPSGTGSAPDGAAAEDLRARLDRLRAGRLFDGVDAAALECWKFDLSVGHVVLDSILHLLYNKVESIAMVIKENKELGSGLGGRSNATTNSNPGEDSEFTLMEKYEHYSMANLVLNNRVEAQEVFLTNVERRCQKMWRKGPLHQ